MLTLRGACDVHDKPWEVDSKVVQAVILCYKRLIELQIKKPSAQPQYGFESELQQYHDCDGGCSFVPGTSCVFVCIKSGNIHLCTLRLCQKQERQHDEGVSVCTLTHLVRNISLEQPSESLGPSFNSLDRHSLGGHGRVGDNDVLSKYKAIITRVKREPSTEQHRPKRRKLDGAHVNSVVHTIRKREQFLRAEQESEAKLQSERIVYDPLFHTFVGDLLQIFLPQHIESIRDAAMKNVTHLFSAYTSLSSRQKLVKRTLQNYHPNKRQFDWNSQLAADHIHKVLFFTWFMWRLNFLWVWLGFSDLKTTRVPSSVAFVIAVVTFMQTDSDYSLEIEDGKELVLIPSMKAANDLFGTTDNMLDCVKHSSKLKGYKSLFTMRSKRVTQMQKEIQKMARKLLAQNDIENNPIDGAALRKKKWVVEVLGCKLT